MTLPRRLIGELLGTALLLVAVVARASWANASAAATWPSRCSRTRWRALIRPFESAGIDVGVNFFIASGYGGQTLEILALRVRESLSNESPVFRCGPMSLPR